MKTVFILLMIFCLEGFAKEASGLTETQIENNNIRKVFVDHAKDVEVCFNKALTIDKNLEGKFYVEFDIAKDGSVIRNASILHKTDWKNGSGENFEKCFLPVMKTWKFPVLAEEEQMHVEFPMGLKK